jgi:hypothetical protein
VASCPSDNGPDDRSRLGAEREPNGKLATTLCSSLKYQAKGADRGKHHANHGGHNTLKGRKRAEGARRAAVSGKQVAV